MLIAVLAAIAAVLVAVVAIAVLYYFVKRWKNSHADAGPKRVKVLDTVGVAPSVGKRAGLEQRVGSDVRSGSKPAQGLASRFVVMELFAGIVFAALGIKALIMQVVNGSTYTKESAANQYTTVYTPAPRGIIYDRSGRELVKNRSSLTVLAESDVADDRDTVLRLSVVLGVPQAIVKRRIEDETTEAQSKRVVASDLDLRKVAFIAEHLDAFPGVTVETRTVREYPYDALGAHLLGYTGTVSEDELAREEEGRNVKSGDEVGKSGVEAAYDNVLCGTHGERYVVTDADSNIVEVVSETDPEKGDDVYLTVDASVQYCADRVLAELIGPDGAIGGGTGVAGAIVAMDVRDGSIICMANYPTFSPAEFIGGISTDVWEVYNSETAYNPMLNRAIAGTYPAASTYKAFTGLAGLEYGYAKTDESITFDCTGSWDGWETGSPQLCWQHAGHGVLDLYGGVVNSCDVVFYEIAKNFYDNRAKVGESAMQDVIKRYRFGELTGVDIDGEAYGRVPTPEWKKEYFKDVPEEATWKGGDSTNMVIGQGYVLITPIQLACAYAGLATGKIPKPHLLKEVRNAKGGASVSFKAETVTEPYIKSEYLQYMRKSLRGVVTENAATGAAFTEYGVEAAAKTGTGEVAGKDDYALCACYAPYDDPRYVVVCVVEEGGGGSDTAVPVCAEVMGAVMKMDAGEAGEVGSIAGSTGKVVERTSSGTSSRTD